MSLFILIPGVKSVVSMTVAIPRQFLFLSLIVRPVLVFVYSL